MNCSAVPKPRWKWEALVIACIARKPWNERDAVCSFCNELRASPAASSKPRRIKRWGTCFIRAAFVGHRSPAPKRLLQTFKIFFLAFLFQFSQTNT
jgi:hypothetical protein